MNSLLLQFIFSQARVEVKMRVGLCDIRLADHFPFVRQCNLGNGTQRKEIFTSRKALRAGKAPREKCSFFCFVLFEQAKKMKETKKNSAIRLKCSEFSKILEPRLQVKFVGRSKKFNTSLTYLPTVLLNYQFHSKTVQHYQLTNLLTY